MRIVMLFLAVALFVSLAGCACPAGHPRSGAQPPPPPKGPRATVQARVIDLRTRTVHLNTGESVPEDALMLPVVGDATHSWRIWVGRLPDSNVPATVWYDNPDPNVQVENGWLYVEALSADPNTVVPPPTQPSPWGVARTKRVSATAVGTRFIVQNDGHTHRVILLAPRDARYRPRAGETGKVRAILDKSVDTKALVKANSYVEVDSDADKTLTVVETIAPNSPVAELVSHIENVVGCGN